MDTALVAPAQFGRDGIAAQHGVDGFGHIGVDRDLLPVKDFDNHVERWRRLALQYALLGAAAPRLLIAEGHGLDAADQVRQGRIQHQVVEVVAVGRADELHAALGDRSGGLSFQFRPDLVDDDDLGHVVLDRLDHHLVLKRVDPDLHPPCPTDGRVRNIAVAGDLVGSVHHHDAFAVVVGQDAGGLAQHRRLADAGAAHDQDRLPGLHEVVDDLYRAVDRSTDAKGQADDLPRPIADGADAMERPLDAGPVVLTEDTDVIDDIGEVGLGDLALEECLLAVGEARLRSPAEVHHNLDQVGWIGQSLDGLQHVRRKRFEKQTQVVDQLAPAGRRARFRHVFSCHMRLAYRRNESGFRYSHNGLLHEQGHGVK